MGKSIFLVSLICVKVRISDLECTITPNTIMLWSNLGRRGMRVPMEWFRVGAKIVRWRRGSKPRPTENDQSQQDESWHNKPQFAHQRHGGGCVASSARQNILSCSHSKNLGHILPFLMNERQALSIIPLGTVSASRYRKRLS